MSGKQTTCKVINNKVFVPDNVNSETRCFHVQFYQTASVRQVLQAFVDAGLGDALIYPHKKRLFWKDDDD